mgnify:CR=1 FL=1
MTNDLITVRMIPAGIESGKGTGSPGKLVDGVYQQVLVLTKNYLFLTKNNYLVIFDPNRNNFTSIGLSSKTNLRIYEKHLTFICNYIGSGLLGQ